MDRDAVFEQIRTATSAEQEREAFERLREYVLQNPGDRDATEVLQQLNEGEWRAVRDRLAGAPAPTPPSPGGPPA